MEEMFKIQPKRLKKKNKKGEKKNTTNQVKPDITVLIYWLHYSSGKADTMCAHIFGLMKQLTKLQSAGYSHSDSE